MVRDILSKLDPSKSLGTDNVHPRVLKECSETLCIPLSLIFNKFFKSGELPSTWLQANVTPLYKKGQNTDPSNYRPVSLTFVACKVMERIIRDRLMSHLSGNNILAFQQHGFRSKRACSTNLLETMDYCTKALTSNQWLDMIFLDFAKAFDKVSHRRLLQKLAAYGISGKLLAWNDVDSGVPQGSVLRPVLFIIFINKLADLIACVGKMYADDTKIMWGINRSNPEPDFEKLQNDIDSILKWTHTWRMQLNIKKMQGHAHRKVQPSSHLHDDGL